MFGVYAAILDNDKWFSRMVVAVYVPLPHCESFHESTHSQYLILLVFTILVVLLFGYISLMINELSIVSLALAIWIVSVLKCLF